METYKRSATTTDLGLLETDTSGINKAKRLIRELKVHDSNLERIISKTGLPQTFVCCISLTVGGDAFV